MLAVGDYVTWKGADKEIPGGTIGRVGQVFGDGDVEVSR